MTSRAWAVLVATVAAACERSPRLDPFAPVFSFAPALCVTEGHATRSGGRLRIDEPSTRGVAPMSTGDAAALEFVYLGPTADVAALASGAVRSQLGLKLRAQDSCNVIYVMWRVAPVRELVVQLKRNPERTTHAMCRADGYARVPAAHHAALPVLAPGTEHTLSASIDGRELRVWADQDLVWQGVLPAEALSLHGPAGFRTDNVVASVAVRAVPGRWAGTCVTSRRDD